MTRRNITLFFLLLFSACTQNRTNQIYSTIDSLSQKASGYYYPGRNILIDSTVSSNPDLREWNVYCTDSLNLVLYIANKKTDSIGNQLNIIAFFSGSSIFMIDYDTFDSSKNQTIESATIYYLNDTSIKYGSPFAIKEIETAKDNFIGLYDEYILHRPRIYYDK